jgi:hypothetical protein
MLVPSPAGVGHLKGKAWHQQPKTVAKRAAHLGGWPARKLREAPGATWSVQTAAAWSLVMGRGLQSLAAAIIR